MMRHSGSVFDSFPPFNDRERNPTSALPLGSSDRPDKILQDLDRECEQIKHLESRLRSRARNTAYVDFSAQSGIPRQPPFMMLSEMMKKKRAMKASQKK
jgi:hypothetical protein